MKETLRQDVLKYADFAPINKLVEAVTEELIERLRFSENYTATYSFKEFGNGKSFAILKQVSQNLKSMGYKTNIKYDGDNSPIIVVKYREQASIWEKLKDNTALCSLAIIIAVPAVIVGILSLVFYLAKIFNRYFSLLLLLFAFNIILGSSEVNTKPIINNVEKPSKIVAKSVQVDLWSILLEALVQVESEGNPNAIGTKNDVGILQLTPIYVEEVNRILGKNKYNLSHRYNPKKSVEMFKILQEYRNPTHSIEKAIQLHNPTAERDYHDKVVAKIREIKADKNYKYQFSKYL